LTTLKYTEKTETGWIIEHIDNNPGTGNGIKTVINADDAIHVVYQDFYKNSIQYAKRLE
jgi:hypothetical protein